MVWAVDLEYSIHVKKKSGCLVQALDLNPVPQALVGLKRLIRCPGLVQPLEVTTTSSLLPPASSSLLSPPPPHHPPPLPHSYTGCTLTF